MNELYHIVLDRDDLNTLMEVLSKTELVQTIVDSDGSIKFCINKDSSIAITNINIIEELINKLVVFETHLATANPDSKKFKDSEFRKKALQYTIGLINDVIHKKKKVHRR